MQQYFAILGKNPTLSFAEILSIFAFKRIKFLIDNLSAEVLVFSTDNSIDTEVLMKILGGTIKIGEILHIVRLDEDESKFYQIFSPENLLRNFLPQSKRKLHVGLSIYDAGADVHHIHILFRQLKDLNWQIKENLDKVGKKVGFVQIKERYLSSVSVSKNRLLDQGTEIIFILTKENVLVGKTLSVQEFESFSFRDYNRPFRDKRVGIIPPKLARMMINLAQLHNNNRILDPFCGSGTFLQEGIILGYKNIIGSDINTRAITHAKRNIEWLFNNFHQLDKSSYNIILRQVDVRYLGKLFSPSSIDAIITEPYLGPPLYKKPESLKAKRILSEVKTLFSEAFSQFNKVLTSRGKVIIIFPTFEIDGKFYFSEVLEEVNKLGFVLGDFFPKEVKSHSVIQLTPRNTILYGSGEQFVKREILIFHKT